MSDRDEEPVEIDHEKVIDGFGHLFGHKYYRSFPSTCGICGRPIVLSARDQKYLLETKGVPVKHLQCAAYCEPCRRHRARINFLKGETGRRGNDELKAELDRLVQEERDVASEKASTRRHFDEPPWPYEYRGK